MRRRKPDFPARWERYEVSYLIQEHIDAWEAFCRQRKYLQQGPLRDSPSEMHRKNMERRRLETATELLDTALREAGPVSFNGRLYKSSESTYKGTEPADHTMQKAEGLFVEIHSPLNGLGRKCRLWACH